LIRALANVGTYWRLGPANLLRVATYRALLRLGWYRLRMPISAPIVVPVLDWPVARQARSHPPQADPAVWEALAQRVLAGELPVFSHHWVAAGFPPNWSRSVITHLELQRPGEHWTRQPDFGLPGGDVKGYWEPARFDGLLILVLGWLCTRREEFRHAIDTWWSSWNAENPPNAGLQWKCGQEASLRLLQGLLAVELLMRWGGVRPTAAFSRWLVQHAQRIAPTMLYAVGQANNHGTSEAAALYCAGTYLARCPGPDQAAGRRWRATGRRWLADRARNLVMADGSFSQHSVTYHRLLMETYSFAETFRRWYGDAAFGAATYERCAAAARWLAAFTDPESGDAPNLGANDGARPFVLDASTYRDFRPTIRWSERLFLERSHGTSDERLAWLGLSDDSSRPAPPQVREHGVQLWHEGGYAQLVARRAWALLRLPRYRFRPSHADAFHLDLWVNGVNVLRDGGTYSYNTADRWLHYFSGTASHNTVQFDDRDSMPRLSRFLFGDWLSCEDLRVDAAACTVMAGYRDAQGARHHRTVTFGERRCSVIDEVDGFKARAVLRWRLAPSSRPVVGDGAVCTNEHLRIAVRSTAPIVRAECVEGWESRHYTEKTALPVFEVEVGSAATLTTEFTWPA
jgi:hypothetical protein